MASSAPVILRSARFDPKLKLYHTVSSSIIVAVTIVGIPLLPIWIPLAYFWWSQRYFEALSCDLTKRSLVLKRGVWFKMEKSIPLGKIQDLSLRHGPLLNALGLSRITIETAGQSGGGAGQGDAVLTGVIDARGFRDAVLAECEGQGASETPASAPAAPDRPAPGGDEAVGLLREIRDLLVRLEARAGGESGEADPPRAQ